MLLDTICGEVEPVPGRPGWFQLTGRHIVRAVALGEFLAGCRVGVDRPVADAKVLGLHDQPALLEDDDRFNGADRDSFAVIERSDGRFFMVLEVHMAEAVLFRFLIPATRPEFDEPLPSAESAASDTACPEPPADAR